jgi:hypothetical protein
MQRRQAAASNDHPYHLTDQDRDAKTYVPKVLGLLLFIPNVTIGTKGLARLNNATDVPHVMAVARTLTPTPLPLGLSAPLVRVVLLAFGMVTVVLALGSPTGSLRGSGGEPRPWRGRPVAEAAGSARARPATSRATRSAAAAPREARAAASLLLVTGLTYGAASRRLRAQSSLPDCVPSKCSARGRTRGPAALMRRMGRMMEEKPLHRAATLWPKMAELPTRKWTHHLASASTDVAAPCGRSS